MSHEDIRKSLKDTEEVPSIGEGRLMQPMDDRPSGQSMNDQSKNEQSIQQQQESKITRDLQEARSERTSDMAGEKQAGEQANVYQGVSEQIPFSYPPVTPAPYQPGQATQAQPRPAQPPYQPGQPAPTQPAYQSGAWSYPPRPEQYQSGPFGQQLPPAGSSPTGQFNATAPGQFGPTQPRDAFGQPFYSSATTPIAPSGPNMTAPASRRSGLRTGTLITLVALLAVVFGTGLFAGWQFGHGGATSPTGNNAFQAGNNPTVTVPQQNNNNADAVREAVISKVQPAIVQINVTSSNQQALGSGVIIDGRGYIVTNNHVVSGASSIQVTLSDNRTFPAQVVGTDPADDLAVIKITRPSSGLATVALGDSSQLRVGQAVLAIGSPLGNAETVTSGIVSALNRNISEGQGGPTLPDAIQTDAPINPGNSGGALVDMQGNLVGMPTLNAVDTEFNTPANGLGFAIPVNRISYIATQIITDGHVTHTGRAMLGVTVTTVSKSIAAQQHLSVNSGVLVVNVTSGGPSASAGLKANDVIVQLDGKAVNSTDDLSKILLQHKPGDTVAVKIYRGSQQLSMNVTLGELSAS